MVIKSVKKISGFTLVELLVVIAIIALLLSILMPSLRKARDAARRIVCMANLHQMGIGVQVFANDHDNVIPTFAATNTLAKELGRHEWHCSWPALLQPYITGTPYDPAKGLDNKVWWCPSDKVSPMCGNISPFNISYGITASLYTLCGGYPAADTTPNPYIDDAKSGVKLARLPQPSSKLYISEHGKLGPGSGYRGDIMYTPVVVPGGEGIKTFDDYDGANHYFGALGSYHERYSSTIFADGHAKSMLISVLSSAEPGGDIWYWGKWPLTQNIPGLR